jgi:hypothetical protein
LVILLSLPFTIPLFLLKNRSKLEKPQFKAKYHSFYLNQKTGSTFALLYTGLFLLRRLVFSISIMLMSNMPFV